MLKTNFTFCAISRNRFYRNVVSVKKKCTKTIELDIGKTVIATCRQMVSNASLPWLRMTAVAGIAIAMNVNADAQCNVFKNADAANPISGVFLTDKYLTGFDFVDIDGDGDLDCYAYYYHETTPRFYKNTGTKNHPIFKEEKTTGFGITVDPGNTAFMQFVDIDGDGDYDFFVSDYNNYWDTDAHIHFYKNVGTRQIPDFVEDTAHNPVDFASADIRVDFTFADGDEDGDYDFYYLESDQYGNPPVQYTYQNIGSKDSASYKRFGPYTELHDYESRTYYDWNKDGLLDYFAFDYYNANYYKNIGPKKNPRYVIDNENSPAFLNGMPYRIVDLNNDGSPEVFSPDAHYSTLAPVAVIEDTVVVNNGKTSEILLSQNRSTTYQYRWEFNGKTILNATQYYIPADKPGTYTLYVTDDCGTGVSLNYVVTKNNVPLEQANDRIAAISNTTTTPVEIKSYPNPFTGAFTLQLGTSNASVESTVKITDLAGKVFWMQRMSASSVQVGQRLPAGTYIVQVWQKGEMVYHSIMLKE